MPPERFEARVAGRVWTLERPADLESLWAGLDETDPLAEERIPYWVELWPATLALCAHLISQGASLAGRKCLDIGCGLGLSALVGASLGAQVVGMDSQHEALHFADKNARRNAVNAPLWVCMDWNQVGFAPAAFDCIWGGDVFYEERFFEPLEKLVRMALAPQGRVWFGDPQRSVSRDVWNRFRGLGWTVSNRGQEIVSLGQAHMTVDVWELRR